MPLLLLALCLSFVSATLAQERQAVEEVVSSQKAVRTIATPDGRYAIELHGG